MSWRTTEQANLNSFAAQAANNPRYATLSNILDRSSPNDGLVNKLSQWNYMRIARLVQATQDYGSYKYAILGSATCTGQFTSFFPAGIRPPANWNNPMEHRSIG